MAEDQLKGGSETFPENSTILEPWVYESGPPLSGRYNDVAEMGADCHHFLTTSSLLMLTA